jgi:hypothetical protein
MLHMTLSCVHLVASVTLVPKPVEMLSRNPELDDEVSGEVLGFSFATFLTPEPEEASFVAAHDHARIGSADEGSAIVDWFSTYHERLRLKTI